MLLPIILFVLFNPPPEPEPPTTPAPCFDGYPCPLPTVEVYKKTPYLPAEGEEEETHTRLGRSAQQLEPRSPVRPSRVHIVTPMAKLTAPKASEGHQKIKSSRLP